MAPPKLKWAMDRSKWKENASPDALGLFSEADRYLAGIEEYRYAVGRTVVDVGLPALTEYNELRLESHWNTAIAHYGIKPDFRFYKACTQWAAANPVDPTSVFLGTWKIDPDATYHHALLGRLRETLTYGCFKPFQWLAFFAKIGLTDSLELRSIAGLVYKSDGMPFKVKRADNSSVDEVKLFYNIVNLTEVLLNIANLRCSLNYREIVLFTSEMRENVHVFVKSSVMLDALLDELVLTFAVAPKHTCKLIRTFLTLVVRTSGSLAIRQRTFVHNNINMATKDRTSDIRPYDFDARELLLPFFNSSVMQKSYREGLELLEKLKMPKLLGAIELYMKVSLVKTDPDHFVAFGSFLQSIMALAGYGRALPCAAAPEQGEERVDDPLNIAREVEQLWLELDAQAKNHGFVPPVDEKWIPACVAYWKSTSAGVAPEKVELVIDGRKQEVKVRKKAAIGALMGKSVFSRSKLRLKANKQNPNSVGYRDVPYKATRLIYVVPLPVQHAEIAVASHLVNYISTAGENLERYDKAIDPSHCTTGGGSTTGQRLVDNYATIAASGDPARLAIGSDLSSYDSRLRYWNFRGPMLSAFKKIHQGNTFGPEKIPGSEMVDYAYGDGHIYKTYWDNGRRPFVYLREGASLTRDLDRYLSDATIGCDIPGIKPMSGIRFVKPGPCRIFDIAKCLEERVGVPWDNLNVGVRKENSTVSLVFVTKTKIFQTSLATTA